MCKPHKASHLEFGVCKLSHVSNHIYVNNSFKLKEYPNIELNGRCKHKAYFYMRKMNYFIFVRIDIFDVHANFALKWQPFIGVNTLVMSSQHNKNMTTSHFDIFYTF